MFQTTLVLLMALWLLGVLTAHTMSGLIHLLLVVAVVMLIFDLIQSRRPV